MAFILACGAGFKKRFTQKPFHRKPKITYNWASLDSPWWVFPETFSLPLLNTCKPTRDQKQQVIRKFTIQKFTEGDCGVKYLLSICVWLECDVPVIVVCKLNTDHLWTVVIFEQWLHLLEIRFKHTLWSTPNNIIPNITYFQCVLSNIHLYRCGFRDFSQDDNAPLVIRTHFLPFLVHLYHRRGCGGEYNLNILISDTKIHLFRCGTALLCETLTS